MFIVLWSPMIHFTHWAPSRLKLNEYEFVSTFLWYSCTHNTAIRWFGKQCSRVDLHILYHDITFCSVTSSTLSWYVKSSTRVQEGVFTSLVGLKPPRQRGKTIWRVTVSHANYIQLVANQLRDVSSKNQRCQSTIAAALRMDFPTSSHPCSRYGTAFHNNLEDVED